MKEEEQKVIENRLINYDSDIFVDFERKRQNGENELAICQIIREDSIDEFVTYVTKNNLSLTSQIPQSIFETNSLLMKSEMTSLIEYCSFYGSIQIFQYLRLNQVKLEKSLWIYSIHGQNPDMIHLLEESKIETEDEAFYLKMIKESIKCHHNDIAHYFIDHVVNKNYEQNDEEFDIFSIQISASSYNNDNEIKYAFQYHNYLFIQINNNYENIFNFACKYNFITLVNLLLNDKDIFISKIDIFDFLLFYNYVLFYIRILKFYYFSFF